MPSWFRSSSSCLLQPFHFYSSSYLIHSIQIWVLEKSGSFVHCLKVGISFIFHLKKAHALMKTCKSFLFYFTPWKVFLLYSHDQLYTYTCGNILNTIKTRRHISLEKYISHFIERVVCERELEIEQRLQHIDPPTLLAITAFLSRSPGLLNRGPGGPASAVSL